MHEHDNLLCCSQFDEHQEGQQMHHGMSKQTAKGWVYPLKIQWVRDPGEAVQSVNKEISRLTDKQTVKM